jgi:hypothetical protein
MGRLDTCDRSSLAPQAAQPRPLFQPPGRKRSIVGLGFGFENVELVTAALSTIADVVHFKFAIGIHSAPAAEVAAVASRAA